MYAIRIFPTMVCQGERLREYVLNRMQSNGLGGCFRARENRDKGFNLETLEHEDTKTWAESMCERIQILGIVDAEVVEL